MYLFTLKNVKIRYNIKSIFIEDLVLPDETMKSYFDTQLETLKDVITYLETEKKDS
jgi:hypothetical protein